MNIKTILSLSLLLIVNLNAISERPIYGAEYIKAKKNAKNALDIQKKEQKKLLLTKEGQTYEQNLEKWYNCMSTANGDNWDQQRSLCKSIEEATKNTLKDLKEIADYEIFRSFARDVAFHENLESGLKSILQTDATYKYWDKKTRSEKINDTINSNKLPETVSSASSMFVEWAEDIKDEEERANGVLRSLVKKIEKLNKEEEQLKEFTTTMQRYYE